MTGAFVFTREADALAARQAIADLLGYPIYAVPVGEGEHVEGAVTRYYSDPFPHPDGTRWAIVVDAVVSPLVPELRARVAALGDPVELDPSWFALPPPTRSAPP